MELNLRNNPKWRIKRDKANALSVPIARNQLWLVDVISEPLIGGKLPRRFNVLGDYSREGSGMEVDHSLPSALMVPALDEII